MAAGVGATACSLLERGKVAELTVRTARAITGAVDLPLSWDVGWQRQEIDRLLDADHSALAGLWTRRLEKLGWIVRSEVSFNRYGDRGRIDLLAFHPMHRVLLVIEIKTVLADAQALLGGLDVKVRNAPYIARDLGWQPRLVVPAIVMADGTTVRRHVAGLEALFGRYSLRGQAASTWLRAPDGSPTGVLTFTELPSSAGSDARRAGRRRIRLPAANSRSNTMADQPHGEARSAQLRP